MRVSDFNLFPFEDSNYFERFCKDYYRCFYDGTTQTNGRRGQRQFGVDVICSYDTPLKWVGIQCKVKNKSFLSLNEIITEIEKAKSFNPVLNEYVIATTESRNAELQSQFNQYYASNKAQIPFNVRIDYWEDIKDELSDEKYEEILIRYYSEFMIDSFHHGFTIGKEAIFIYGVEDNYSSQRDLLFLRIPQALTPTKEAKVSGIGYNKGIMIVDLDAKRVSSVRDKFYESDLEPLFPDSRFERALFGLRFSKMDLLKEVIYSDKDCFRISFTKEEYKRFIDSDLE